MWRLVILLLSSVLYCYAQTPCDDIEMSQEEKDCLVTFTSNMMGAYMSLADSMENSSDASTTAVAINAMRGAFGEACKDEVCLKGIKKAYVACEV